MSNDLISRKALINALFVRNGKMCPDTNIDNFPITINVKDVKKAIRNAPTAYDVDKVVKELDGVMFLTTNDDGETDDLSIPVMEADEVIKIVKSGGIE